MSVGMLWHHLTNDSAASTHVGKPAHRCCIPKCVTPILHTDVGLANLDLDTPFRKKNPRLAVPPISLSTMLSNASEVAEPAEIRRFPDSAYVHSSPSHPRLRLLVAGWVGGRRRRPQPATFLL